MIRVRVHINVKQVIDIHAVRENIFRGMSKRHAYRVFITDETILKEHEYLGTISHKYSLGASRLSVRMLQMYYRKIDKR